MKPHWTTKTSHTRDASEDSDITNLLGYESSLGKLFPDAVSAASVASLGSKSTSTGTGSIARSESISLVVAAIITQVLPNGNFVISGAQEVRVNFEKRILTITGAVRPEDISARQHNQAYPDRRGPHRLRRRRPIDRRTTAALRPAALRRHLPL